MEQIINANLVTVVQCTAVLLSGLVAGLFYGYDCSVTKGLAQVQPDAYLQSFQAINKAIQTPYFFVSFLGCLLLLPVATWLSRGQGQHADFYLLLSATLIYYTGVFGVTIMGNIPLNERLANFPLATATENEKTAMRNVFEHTWNLYHRIRTVASVVAFVLTIAALVKQKN